MHTELGVKKTPARRGQGCQIPQAEVVKTMPAGAVLMLPRMRHFLMASHMGEKAWAGVGAGSLSLMLVPWRGLEGMW